MAFLKGLRDLLSGSRERARKPINECINTEVDPATLWDNVGELGDGAFGKVYKVSFM